MQEDMDNRTVAVSNGIAADAAFGAVAPPLYLSSNFAFRKFETSQQYEYSRTSNPTREVLADTIAKLEGGVGAVVTSSGMSALHLVLSSLKVGDRVVAPHDCYGGTHRLLTSLRDKGQLTLDFVDQTDPEALRVALGQDVGRDTEQSVDARGRYSKSRPSCKGSRVQAGGRQYLSLAGATATDRAWRRHRDPLNHQVSQRSF